MQTSNKIRKAVFPVAGLGTRFLPATKACPKEMLPVVDKPLIQYAVDEAISAGITELVFVTSSGKNAIEDYFDSNPLLENTLAEQGKIALLKAVQEVVPKGVSTVYVRQPQALGLGHAVLCARPVVGNEPFAVLLADDLIDAKPETCLQQMVKLYEETQQSVIAVEQISPTETEKYGVIDVPSGWKQAGPIQGIVEKPAAKDAPSNYGVVGRYLLKPEIFGLLASTQQGSGGEIQLTDAIEALRQSQEVHALHFEGARYDCGSKLGYLKATVNYAKQHPEVSKAFIEFLYT